MIQRIQTVYLVLVAALTAAMFVFPFATFSNGVEQYEFVFSGVRSAAGNALSARFVVLPAILCVNFLAAVSGIFLFRKRILQMRLTTFNAILFLLLYGVLGFTAWTAMPFSLDEFAFSLGVSAVLPLVNVIFCVLAVRGIAADEALVQSLNRLR